MAGDWKPIFVLPNVPLQNAIGCDVVALASAHDPRVAALKRAQPMFRRFLGRFSDNFGEKFEPAMLLVRADAPRRFFEVATLASFRDLIAISTVAYNRALELRSPRGHRVVFGEAFAIYPWMLDKHYQDVIGSTPAILGTHEVAKFKGQSSPSIFRTALDDLDLDRPLLTALLDRWRRRYEVPEPDWVDIALFRSLNMAYHASLLPAATDTTFYDVGRLVSLWVSAFEILVHPGGNGRAAPDKVFRLIEKTRWELEATADLAFDTGGKSKVRRTLASRLYQALYDSRNSFLHGNPVERADLILPVSGRSIFEYAAPLYRLALTSFLPLTYDKPMPSSSEAQALGEYIADRMDFMHPQRQIEEAILTANQPPDQRPVRHRRMMRLA
jgi:hypothetical protein